MTQQFFNVKETAEILGYHRKTVSIMLRKGELSFIPRGRNAKRIPLSEIARWQKANTVTGSEQLRKALDGRRAGA